MFRAMYLILRRISLASAVLRLPPFYFNATSLADKPTAKITCLCTVLIVMAWLSLEEVADGRFTLYCDWFRNEDGLTV